MSKRSLATVTPQTGYACEFEKDGNAYKITWIDFLILFYKNGEQVNSKEFEMLDTSAFVNYCYGFCDIFDLKKSKLYFKEI